MGCWAWQRKRRPAAIDAPRAKWGVVVAALAAGAAVIYTLPFCRPMLVANTLMAIVGGVSGPAVAALTLGLYVRTQLARWMGRNAAFDHAGNVGIAIAAGAVGYLLSQRAVLLTVPGFALLAVMSIPHGTVQAVLDMPRTKARSKGR